MVKPLQHATPMVVELLPYRDGILHATDIGVHRGAESLVALYKVFCSCSYLFPMLFARVFHEEAHCLFNKLRLLLVFLHILGELLEGEQEGEQEGGKEGVRDGRGEGKQ